MAYQDPAAEIARRARQLVTAVNAALQAHYRANKTDQRDQLSVGVSAGKGGQARTPEDQAAYVLQNKSWTCNGSHMGDAAAHLLVRRGGVVTFALGELARNHKAAWTVLTNAWNTSMVAQDLRNVSGAKGFDPFGGDALHMELPNSRLADTDPQVTQCLMAYAKATRFDGQAKNTDYETSKGSAYQRQWLQTYDAKVSKGWRP